MNDSAWQEKCRLLLEENLLLRQEISTLRARLGISDPPKKENLDSTAKIIPDPIKTTNLDSAAKIALFRSLFQGREDVYACRWENRAGRSGYAPVCLQEWAAGICRKPAVKCSECGNRRFATLDDKAIEAHLRGEIVVGLYPLDQDDSCKLLAIDLDGDEWQKDVTILREACTRHEISAAVERSRSGNGAHIWFFFSQPVSAILARRFGTALLTWAMSRRHEISFRSYDRLFPNQDTLPKGGFGNLIALPLQKRAREKGNSVFLDEQFRAFPDQWGYLSRIPRFSADDLEKLLSRLGSGGDLGELRQDTEEGPVPWEKRPEVLSKDDFPERLQLVRADKIYLPKSGISQRALNALKRLAAFRNPEFYKAQAMRLPTYNKPRIISCSEETADYLCLPRGCEEDLVERLTQSKVPVTWIDRTCSGRVIRVAFQGVLQEEQNLALQALLRHRNGVLAAATAFGKTVLAAGLIAERGVNTLILTHRRQLLLQWMGKLSQFLAIDEEPPIRKGKRRGRIQATCIGQIGAGKDRPTGIVDVAVMQSLISQGEVKDSIRQYGMVIVDECHHVPAFCFEQVLKNVPAKYVYGLTATPVRQDGHHPILFMQCGPVRYRVEARSQTQKRSFTHSVIPRFTAFRMPWEREGGDRSIQELYAAMVDDESRNRLIVEDVCDNFRAGRHSLVLTHRTAHVEILAGMLAETIPEVITLTGGRGEKVLRSQWEKIQATPADRPLTLVATGKFIGEGFDEPRLDTLFLASPIAWKGTLQQYAGRLHRAYATKREVRIYDYIDIHIRVMERMYAKRLKGYASIGYRMQAESVGAESTDLIYDRNDFLPVFLHDVKSAAGEILVVSPYVTQRRTDQMLAAVESILQKKIPVTVVTRPSIDYKEKDRPAREEILRAMEKAGVQVVCRSNFHQKFAVIDRKIVWYGSINLLSFGGAEESMMRLVSTNIAQELMDTIREE